MFLQLVLFQWISDAPKKKLVALVEIAQNILVRDISVFEDIVIVCDLVKTPCLYKYVESSKTLEFISYYHDDFSWTTAVEAVSKDTLLTSDSALRLSLLILHSEKLQDKNVYNYLRLAGSTRTGEFVNKIVKCTPIFLSFYPSISNQRPNPKSPR